MKRSSILIPDTARTFKSVSFFAIFHYGKQTLLNLLYWVGFDSFQITYRKVLSPNW